MAKKPAKKIRVYSKVNDRQTDPHSGCIEPHHSEDGYVDCEGRPL